MAEGATWSTANSKNPAFFTVNARQFWLRRTLLKFEERAAEFPPNLGKTSEGLIDQSNLNLSKTRSLRFDRSPNIRLTQFHKLSMAKDKLWGYLNGICSDRIKLSFG